MSLLTHIRNGLSHYTNAATLQGVCQKAVKGKSKCSSIIFLCKAHAAKLLNAFGIDTNNDDNRVHPEHFCPSCKRALERVISAMHR